MSLWQCPAANPSSLHTEGRAARAAVDVAREVLSDSLGCLFGEVHFTSSGTEAANLAIIGTALANKDDKRRRILMGASEHHCVLHTQPILEALGYRVELIPVTREAAIERSAYETLLCEDVLLVCVMQANNELGTINPIQDLVGNAKEVGALFFTDAVQSYPEGGPMDELGIDLLSVSAHKVYGPQGAGALYIRAGTAIQPILVGGGQEREMRAGTENVAAIVGFAEAVKTLSAGDRRRVARDRFRDLLVPAGFVPTVPESTNCLSGHFHCRYPGVDAETFLIMLDREGVSASSGAACSSGSLEPSHVLLACGYSQVEAQEGLRFTFGRGTTIEEAEEAARRTIRVVKLISERKGPQS